ncbi:4-oxalocrotonate tautomerase DmpI [Pelovirga terrestris]|uniref:Tautomerase family protein n=1 Tax=Pelovirga terrestris TaxID=2771352 RepID=A0A8J6UR83_9BACT|nr:4-oxalocrotonate tautomerase DmpI [Pelovirga terrestris]MBD1400816.1 tautomerase family protein [Pelovirga terrestris]
MPIITLDGPPLSLDKKRLLTNELTSLAARAYDLPESTIIIMLRENTPDQVAVGGILIADR